MRRAPAASVSLAATVSARRWLTSRAAAREARMAAARQDFEEKGIAIIPGAVDAATVASLRAALRKGVTERAEHLQTLPKAMDVFRQQQQQPEPDPLYAKFVKKFKEVAKRKREERRRKRLVRKAEREGRPNPFLGAPAAPTKPVRTSAPSPPKLAAPPKLARDATRDDLWAMSQKIAKQLVAVPAQASSIFNDPARLKAINDHRCNVWMTNEVVKDHVFGSLGGIVGSAVSQVAGVRDPVLFADRPFVRDPFQRPTMLHCAAPFMGVDAHALVAENGEPRLATCMAWVMLDDCDGLSSALWHLPGSHKVIHAALRRGVRTGGVDVRKLSVDFAAMDSDIAHWLRHFPELEDVAAEEHRAPAGTIVVCDPHLLVSTGPNFTRQTHVSMQMLVASAADTKGSVHPSSWVRAWKAQSKQVDLRNNVIFPPLRGPG